MADLRGLQRSPVICGLLAAGCLATASPANAAGEGIEFFEARIRPALVEHCYECHAGDSAKGEFQLDSAEALLRGGASGLALVSGDPEASLLIEAIKYESFEMPPDGPLPDAVIADFEAWVAMGAPDPRTDGPTVAPVSESESTIDLEAGRRHWAFQPLGAEPAPRSPDDWEAFDPLDGFIHRKVAEASLAPAGRADRRMLIRRLSFDVLGLPPAPEEVDDFLADEAPDAALRLADRYYASPRFGERWARPWLDLARYAEDQAHIVGDNRSLCYPNAYLYRDWVIDGLNRNLTYDEFVRRQLAADVAYEGQDVEPAALGFLGLGPKYYGRGSLKVQVDEWEDRVDVVSRGLLGLTVACARCHDHKFDPISAADFHALAGVFASTEMFNRPLDDDREANDAGQAKDPLDAMHIVREGNPRNLHLFVRGDVERKGAEIPRGFLAVLTQEEPQPFVQGSGRAELADAILSDGGALAARVIVNRIWREYFGAGIVGTPSNFGALGEPPTHPALLDRLAADFVGEDWNLKRLHRRLTASATYQRTSNAPELATADPANRWLARASRKRLPIEAWRDALLAASDNLASSLGGESFNPEEPSSRRRTVYAEVSRLELNATLARFDFPDPNAHSAARVTTTTALQKLYVLNSPFMEEQAKRLTQRFDFAASDPTEAQRAVAAAYRQLFARPPTRQESLLAVHFLSPNDDSRALQYAQALLASSEMLFVD